MKLIEMIKAGPSLDAATWYGITTLVYRELVPGQGTGFAGGFEAALNMVRSYGLPDDMDELFQVKEEERPEVL